MRGKFIVLEGGEGCGKTTQGHLLYHYLTQRGYNVFEAREPGGTEVSEKIRTILLDVACVGMSAVTELFLYEAARAQITSEILKPRSLKGIVLADRCYHSSIAYQGFGRGLDISFILKMNRYAMDGLKPNLTIIYDIPVEIGLRRAIGLTAGDRLEQESRDFHERVRQGYLSLAEILTDENIVVIDSSKSIQEVFKKTKKYIDKIL